MDMLAETLISGEWITGLVVAAITAMGTAALAYKKGAASTAQNIALQNPLPEFPTRKVLTPPSWDAHRALVDRVTALEAVTQELRRETSQQYHELLKAGGERETHLSDKLDGIARGIHARIDEILQQRLRPRS